MNFDVNRLQKKINANFKNQELLELALTHRSIGQNNNERLEFLGDSILGFIIADEIFMMFPTAEEGVMSRMRAHLVNGRVLAEISKDMGLSDELILGQGEKKSGGKNRASILSDALEAIIGAMYKDAGLGETKKWILSVFKDRLDALSLDAAEKDPKTRLQEYLQSRGRNVPEYTVTSTSGADHNQLFTVACQVDSLNEVIKASSSTRKKAEQKAASKALTLLSI
ncbi:MAG: ribonuclease III [Cycloclasticus sp.]|nr:ribonuclease III [Cycloclasticus sp.]